jgi:cbb3-type cytochrome oxidase subunit 3
MKKKAQFQSVLLVIITIFILGVILFFFNHMNKKIYDSFDNYFTESPEYNNTEAHETLKDIQSVEGSNIWDWAFLAIFIGLIIQIVMFSFATRINIAFYWIMVILDIPILIVGVVLSNVWQELAYNAEFTTTITRFPITNLLLGSYYPIAITILIFFASIILFGKKPE